MIALLDNGQDLDECADEIGGPVGQLLTPLTRYRLRTGLFAIDNGSFAGFDEKAFLALLKREEERRTQCLFVAAPDIVGSAVRTLELFDLWKPRLDGWPIALVCQDGQENHRIPWDDIAAVFIGGSTNWKCSHHVEHIVKTAKLFGKWVHAGRVNDPQRFKHFEEMGVDSCDGTGLARYSHMRLAVRDRTKQGNMFDAA